MKLTAIPFDEAGFSAWQDRTQIDYAKSKVDSGAWPESGARDRARVEHDKLLPHGNATPGHVIHQVIDAEKSSPVGRFWVGPATGAPPETGWLFDIAIEPAYRGQGLGREVMALAEKAASDLGYARLGLHVFGDNTIARRLYESCGYAVTDLCMAKDL